MSVDGVKYSGALFRRFALGRDIRIVLFKIVSLEDGMVTIQEVRDAELAHRFDLVAKAGVAGVGKTGVGEQ